MKLSSPIGLIKKSIQVFFARANLIFFLKIYTPLALLAIISVYLQNFASTNYQLGSWASAAVLIFGLIQLLTSFWIGLAGIYAVSGIVSGNPPPIKNVYQIALKGLWKFSLLSILLFLITLGGGILLIIPGVIFSVWYSFSTFVFAEREGVFVSLKQSKNLVKGRFWKVFGREIVFGLFYLVLQVIAVFIPYSIGSILTSLIGALFILPSYLLYKELSV